MQLLPRPALHTSRAHTSRAHTSPRVRVQGSAWSLSHGGRTSWLLSCRASTSVVELAQLLTSLEATVRDLQGIGDVAERKPWRVDGHKFIGKMARRFFTAYGISDGRIVGWLPPDGDDPALWHMVHGDDDDEEDLDEREAQCVLIWPSMPFHGPSMALPCPSMALP